MCGHLSVVHRTPFLVEKEAYMLLGPTGASKETERIAEPLSAQAELLSLSRSSIYYVPHVDLEDIKLGN